jgi:hypothetical protein
MIEPMNAGTGSTSADIGGLPDRRGTGRFPVREDLRYRVVQSRTARVSGVGSTLNIGSGGILFTTEDKLPLGLMVELAVNWPAMLDGICPLQFVATGRVVRSEAQRAAVRIEKYEFKTRNMNRLAMAAGASFSHPGERCL